MKTDVKHMKKLVTAALCLALCLVLPFLTANNMALGNMLSLMHLPVLLCGLVCGWPFGLLIGFIAPLMRSFLLSAPPLMVAVPMAFELAAYGFISGFLARRLPKNLKSLYIALISALLCGRVVWGIVMTLITLKGSSFTFTAFMAGAFTNAIPGIILQLVAIPAIVFTLQKIRKAPAEV